MKNKLSEISHNLSLVTSVSLYYFALIVLVGLLNIFISQRNIYCIIVTAVIFAVITVIFILRQHKILKMLGNNISKLVYYIYIIILTISVVVMIGLCLLPQDKVSAFDAPETLKLAWTIFGISTTVFVFLSERILSNRLIYVSKVQTLFSIFPAFIDFLLLAISTIVVFLFQSSDLTFNFVFISSSLILAIANTLAFIIYSTLFIDKLIKDKQSKMF